MDSKTTTVKGIALKEGKELSFNALKFGSEEDFRLAITELKWMKDSFGKVTDRDFEEISSKYDFPTDFLKHGFKGLKFPDDYRISKSKWFPILYSWVVQNRETSNKLFRLQIDYKRAKFTIFRNLAILVGIAELIIIMMWNYELLDMLNLSLLILTFALFFVALFFEMYNPLNEKRTTLEEYSHLLRQKGLEKIIEENEKFLKSMSTFVRYAGNIVKKKIEEGTSITIFAPRVKDGTLIVDDYEFPDQEYRNRISQLMRARRS